MGAPRPRHSRAGFTLLEVLGVVLLTALVFTAAVNFYRDLSRKSTHAVELTRDVRFASMILDRVARDLEGTVLVKKPEAKDPLEHPWVFLAVAQDEGLGADQIKFMTRSHVPRTGSLHESDFEVVAYMLHRDRDGTLELLRWSSPQLPDGLDRSFPSDPADGALVLARGIEQFGVRFLGADGKWKGTWDSSEVADADQLPLAAEISLALVEDPPPDRRRAEPPAPYVRRVLIPLRPLDLDKMLHPDQTGDKNAKAGDSTNGGMTVAQCLALNPGLSLPIDPSALASIQDQSIASVAKSAGFDLPGNCK
ncbi:MAG TPA: type II secretion system protein GspJ [Myxococcota bacterium]|nr:type II secretion system protein GspJ [Myxococcota bacterium]